ncbi:unnamed protein product [Bathycoccus prasinos]
MKTSEDQVIKPSVVIRSSGSSSKVRIGTNSNQIAAEDHPYTIFRFSTQVFMVFRNGGVCLLFSNL